MLPPDTEIPSFQEKNNTKSNLRIKQVRDCVKIIRGKKRIKAEEGLSKVFIKGVR